MTSKRQHLHGIDGIRFLCALIVVLGHFGGPPLLEGIDTSKAVGLFVNAIYNNVFVGPAAVIVFFVVSGLCIHYANAVTLKIPNLKEYFTKRYMRIIVPLIAAVTLSNIFTETKLSRFENTILWSLYAELIYYTIYPVLIKIRQRLTSWMPLIFISFIIALIISFTNPYAGNYPSFGVALNWALGLPCWLLGCLLAEKVSHSKKSISPQKIHLWRLAVIIAAMLCSIARFHASIGYPWSLNFFAILVFFWLYHEIIYYQTKPASPLLAWAGTWSYSLYLTHVLFNDLFAKLTLPSLGYLLDWLLQMIFILIGAYIFAFIFEFPAHKAARKLGKFASKKRAL